MRGLYYPSEKLSSIIRKWTMKALVRRRLGLCILVALSVPFGIVFFMGTIYAQGFRRPPLRPPILRPQQPLMPRIPKVNTPKFEWVWKCTRCQGELGRGQVKPTLATCPHCGARFIGSTGFDSFKPPVTQPQQPAFQPPVTQPQQPNFKPNPLVVNNNQPAPINQNPQPQTMATSGTVSTTTDRDEGGSISAGVIVLIVVSAIALLAGIGVAIFVKLSDSTGTRDDLRDPYRKRKSFPGREVI
jgi:DNA-directed RNA polymerase subunit RPC12/RpoP